MKRTLSNKRKLSSLLVRVVALVDNGFTSVYIGFLVTCVWLRTPPPLHVLLLILAVVFHLFFYRYKAVRFRYNSLMESLNGDVEWVLQTMQDTNSKWVVGWTRTFLINPPCGRFGLQFASIMLRYITIGVLVTLYSHGSSIPYTVLFSLVVITSIAATVYGWAHDRRVAMLTYHLGSESEALRVMAKEGEANAKYLMSPDTE